MNKEHYIAHIEYLISEYDDSTTSIPNVMINSLAERAVELESESDFEEQDFVDELVDELVNVLEDEYIQDDIHFKLEPNSDLECLLYDLAEEIMSNANDDNEDEFSYHDE